MLGISWSFEKNGMYALPWPVPRKTLDIDEVADFLPDPRVLAESFYALHELIRLAYYQWGYR